MIEKFANRKRFLYGIPWMYRNIRPHNNRMSKFNEHRVPKRTQPESKTDHQALAIKHQLVTNVKSHF